LYKVSVESRSPSHYQLFSHVETTQREKHLGYDLKITSINFSVQCNTQNYKQHVFPEGLYCSWVHLWV